MYKIELRLDGKWIMMGPYYAEEREARRVCLEKWPHRLWTETVGGTPTVRIVKASASHASAS